MPEADAPHMPDRNQLRSGCRLRPVVTGTAATLIVAALAGVGIWRVELADRLILHEVQALHLPARWQLRGVGVDGALIGRITIGDPARPDLTIERVEVATGLTGISSVTLRGLRLHGHLSRGHLSFGSLDALLNGPSTTPLSLPGWDLRLIDAQAIIDGDAGVFRLTASGSGGLRDGFSGKLEGNSPLLALNGCKVTDSALAAHVTIAASQPQIDGGITSGELSCGGVAYAHPRLTLTARLAPSLDGGEGRVTLGPLAGGPVVARGLELAGQWHSGGGGQPSGAGTLSGEGIAPSVATLAAMTRGVVATRGTLVSPLLAAITQPLSNRQGARLSGHWALSGADGDWLTLSHLTTGPGGPSGGFALGGGLPGLTGQISSAGHGPHARVMVAMRGAPFAAGGARVALPLAQLVKSADGSLALRGALLVSGPLPGGRVEELSLALDGSWKRQSGAPGVLRLGTACAPIRFGELALGGVMLRRQAVTLCPVAGALITMRGGQANIAGQVGKLALAGSLAGEPLRVTSGPLTLAWSQGGQGTFSAKGLAIGLGGDKNAAASHFALGSVLGRLGGAGASGSFASADVTLGAVPADIVGAAGQWHWQDGALRLEETGFQLKDRAGEARFNPLVARGASLELRQGVIRAEAALREPTSNREVARLTLAHDLSNSQGRLGFTLPAVTFDKDFQPEAITPLTLGVVANASGSLSGEGEIGWADGRLTSHASFATPGLDFAAPFGPVKGVVGRVTFTDLIGLVTAPDQQVRIASINPGIEVDIGVVSFALLPGRVRMLNGVEWPFIVGRLRLLPTRRVFGASEVRRYELVIEGLNAAKFLQYLDLSNIGATGIFDGHLPLVFVSGSGGSVGRIEGGLLTARPGGGSVSYVGALSYRDMQPMANYAFRMLRSLKYTSMQIGMDGPLDGDIVTRMQLSGVGQGPGASRNFLTRQIARVPIQFNINIRAPFYRMVTSFKSFSDPSLLTDPRTLGLVGADGRPLPGRPAIAVVSVPDMPSTPLPGSNGGATPARPNPTLSNPALSVAQPGIQPSVSEHRP